jgi:hypothetical protein
MRSRRIFVEPGYKDASKAKNVGYYLTKIRQKWNYLRTYSAIFHRTDKKIPNARKKQALGIVLAQADRRRRFF